MTIFYGTFGSGQLGTFGLRYHVEIKAPDEISARRILNTAFEGKWSGIYDSSKLDYPAKYKTKCLGTLVFDHYDGHTCYFQTRFENEKIN